MRRCTSLISRGLAAAVIVGTVLVTSCTEPTAAPAPEPIRIDAAKARALLLAKYRQLFARKYYRVDDEYHEFPPLAEDDFRHVTLNDDAWDVRCEPLVGYYVTGRVAKDGAWVDLDRVGFANQ